MENCRCKSHEINTPYCPNCGNKTPTGIHKRYPVDGRTMVNPALAIRTDHFREPLKGEYFLSGAYPIAYKAFQDMSTKYWICEIVK